VSGTSGSSGSAGTIGASGANRTSGVSGTSGSSGSNGNNGQSGISGSSGTSGTTGSQGAKGNDGQSALSGSSGTSGTTGSSGLTFNGSSGISGGTFTNQPNFLVRTTGTTTIQSISFLFADITNDRLGIGTNTPLYPVVIANRGPSGTPQRSLAIGNTATNGTFMYLGSSASTSGYNMIQSITTEGTAFGNLILQPDGGNLGVATTSPQAKLHVGGTIRIDSTSTKPPDVAEDSINTVLTNLNSKVIMGEPDNYLQVNIDGTVYAIPAYIPE
jgi:hypothetical protein